MASLPEISCRRWTKKSSTSSRATTVGQHHAKRGGRRKFDRIVPTALPYPHQARGMGQDIDTLSISLAVTVASRFGAAGEGMAITAGFVGWVARLTGLATVSLLYLDDEFADAGRGIEPWSTPAVR
jgi:hypothetical protein